MSADALHARFDAAADGLVPPADPVGLVRARVGERRRRRTRARVAAASGAAVAVLLTGVVVGPDRFTPDSTPPAGAPTGTSQDVGPLLSPDGLPGLRLGDPAPRSEEYGSRGTASGCEATSGFSMLPEELRSVAGEATEVTAWSRDGEVVALWLAVPLDRVELAGDVPRTWLGPTLRDPMAQALELDGARLVTEEPAGDDGPAVTSVVVALDDGAEVVFVDMPYRNRSTGGRITFVGLRTEAGRACRLVPGEDVPQPGQGTPDQGTPVLLTPRGLPDPPLGASAAQAVADGVLEPLDADFGDPLDGRGCTTYRTTDDIRVWADDDRVVAVGSLGYGPRFRLDGDVRFESGDPAAVVAALPGAVEARGPVTVEGNALDLPVGTGVRALVSLLPEQVSLEATGVLFEGRPLVDGVVVYQQDDPTAGPADGLCSG